MLYCANLPVRGVLALHIVADDSALCRIDFQSHAPAAECRPTPSHTLLAEALRQLRAYFAGDLREFQLPLAPKGTEFQRRVWRDVAIDRSAPGVTRRGRLDQQRPSIAVSVVCSRRPS